MDMNWIREWYDRNPVGAVLVVSFSLVLIFGWGQMSSMIGWVILAAYLIDRVLKHVRGDGSTGEIEEDDQQPAEDPLQELRHRYARGEIREEEFERKVERLMETESMDRTDDRELLTETS